MPSEEGERERRALLGDARDEPLPAFRGDQFIGNILRLRGWTEHQIERALYPFSGPLSPPSVKERPEIFFPE